MKVLSRCLTSARAPGRPLRLGIFALALLAAPVSALHAQFSIGIGMPGVSIGINFPQAPTFVRVPGYPAYYAPQSRANLFFYDGLYWVFVDDDWYAGSWYNGPWSRVPPQYVPLYLLRIPVRYYRVPPPYFRSWRSDAPPRWDEHWGKDWAREHRGWDQWDRRRVPAPAPLPIYQRPYAGDRYPTPDRQLELRRDNYRYQPRDPIVRQQFQPPAPPRAAAQAPAPSRPQQPYQGGDDPGSRQRRAPQPQAQAPQRAPQPQPQAQPQHGRPDDRGAPPGHKAMPPGQAKKEDKHDKGDKSDKADKGDRNDDKDRKR